MILDPVIHRIASHKLYVRHGFAHAPLQYGIDVGEEEILRIAIRVRNFGLKGAEDIQLRVVRLGLVQVFKIRAFPEEALARSALNAHSINAAFFEYFFLLRAEVLADNGDHAHIGKEAGCERKVRCRPAEATLATACGSFNGVKCNTADDSNSHSVSPGI